MIPAYVKYLGDTSLKAAGTTLGQVLQGGGSAAGNLIVARVIFDNAATASKPVVSSISKMAGETNNWVFLGAARSTSTSAGAFASGEMWCIQTTVAWSGTITVTLDTSVTQKAVLMQEFSGVQAVTRSTVGTNYSTTTTAASAVTTGTAPVINDLAIGLIFGSNIAAQPAGDNDTTAGSWSAVAGLGSTGGSGATNNFGVGQYKVLTAATHQTYNNSGGAITAGNGSVVAILQAIPDPSITQAAYQWYDEGTEADATPLANQDTPVVANIANGDATGTLRVRLQSTTAIAVPATDDFTLQYEKASATEALADAYPATNYAANRGAATPTIWAQSFLGDGGVLTRAGFYLGKQGAPTGNVTAALYAHTGSLGSGLPTGSPLAVSTTSITHSTLPTSLAWTYFNFNPYTLVNGTSYCIAVTTSSTEAGTLLLGVDDTSPTHVGLGAANTTGSWLGQGLDLIFEVYTKPMWPWTNVGETLLATYALTNRDSSYGWGDTTIPSVGHSFMGNGSTISRVRVMLAKSGTPTGDLFCHIYAHTGTFGTTGVPTGSSLVSSVGVPFASLTGTQTAYDFVFTTAFTLTNGVPYFFVLEPVPLAVAGSNPGIGSDVTTPSATGNSARKSGASWGVYSSGVFVHEVYTAATNRAVVAYASPNLPAASPTTNRLGAGTGSFVAGEISEDGTVNDLGWAGNNYTEVLYALNVIAAEVADGDTLRFRVLRNGATTGMTYTQTPTINVTLVTGPGPVNLGNASSNGIATVTAAIGANRGLVSTASNASSTTTSALAVARPLAATSNAASTATGTLTTAVAPIALAGSSAGATTIGGAAAPAAVDDFNRADGALGAAWAQFDSSPVVIASNKAVPSGPGNCGATYETALAADQWCEGDMAVTAPPDTSLCPCVRMDNASGNCYYAWIRTTGPYIELWRRVGAGYQQLGSSVPIASGNAKVRIEAEGTTLRVYTDDVLRITETDSNVASGKAGIWAYSNNTPLPTLDNFRCGGLPYGAAAGIDLLVTRGLAGAANGIATTTSALRVARPLVGASSGVAGATGGLARSVPLSGASGGVSSASGTLTAGASAVLASSSAGVSSTTSALLVTRGLTATVAGLSTVTGALAAARPLAGATSGASTVSGAGAVTRGLSGATAGAATAGATVAVARPVVASSAGVSSASGTVVVARALVAESAGVSTVTAGLVVSQAGGMASFVSGTSTVTGALGVARPLVASSAGVSTVTAAAAMARRLVASSAGLSTPAGNARVTRGLTASAGGIGAAGGTQFVVARRFTSTAGGVATVTGTLTSRPLTTLQGASVGSSTATGTLVAVTVSIIGWWNGQQTVAMMWGDQDVVDFLLTEPADDGPVIDTIAIDAASVCAVVLERINNALDECGRPARAAYVAAGLVAWDDCCGMLVVAPERIFRTARFPIEGPDENNCYDGLIAVSLVALLVRCVPVLDDSGRPPTAEALGDAYAEVLADAGVVWNELSRWPEGWESSGQAQTFVGAEGGCIGVESRVTVGLDQEVWCPPC